MLKWVLIASSIYLALIGFGLIFVPQKFGIGAVPEDASPELIALLRILGGPPLGIAVLNFLTRNHAPSTTLSAVVLANIVGFGAVAANDVLDVISGEAREAAKIFLVIHVAMTLAFVLAGRDLLARRDQPRGAGAS